MKKLQNYVKINAKTIAEDKTTFGQILNNRICYTMNNAVTININKDMLNIQAVQDNNIYISKNYKIENSNHDKKSTLVYAKKFFDILKEHKKEELYINIENEDLIITTKDGRSYNKLYKYNLSEHSQIKPFAIDNYKELSINKYEFLEAVKNSCIAVSQEAFKPSLTGINIQTKNNKLHIAGCDGRLLITKAINYSGTGEINSNIKEDVINSLIKNNKELKKIDKTEELKLYVNNEKIVIIDNDIEYKSNLIESKYPNYEAVIPESEAWKNSGVGWLKDRKNINSDTIELKKEEVKAVIKTLKNWYKIYKDLRNDAIQLYFYKNTLILSGLNTEICASDKIINLSHNKDYNVKKLFSLKRLISLFNNINGYDATITIYEDQPARIDYNNFTSILMPMVASDEKTYYDTDMTEVVDQECQNQDNNTTLDTEEPANTEATVINEEATIEEATVDNTKKLKRQGYRLLDRIKKKEKVNFIEYVSKLNIINDINLPHIIRIDKMIVGENKKIEIFNVFYRKNAEKILKNGYKVDIYRNSTNKQVLNTTVINNRLKRFVA